MSPAPSGRFEYDDLQGHIRNERGDIIGYTDDGLSALDQLPAQDDAVPQRSPFEKFHSQEVLAVDLANFVDRANV